MQATFETRRPSPPRPTTAQRVRAAAARVRREWTDTDRQTRERLAEVMQQRLMEALLGGRPVLALVRA
jgi:hypothetical protein